MTPCDHSAAVPVESVVTGETLAALCPACDRQLPARFLGCTHDDVIEVTSLGERPGRCRCNDCGTTGWYGSTGMSFANVETLVARMQASQ